MKRVIKHIGREVPAVSRRSHAEIYEEISTMLERGRGGDLLAFLKANPQGRVYVEGVVKTSVLEHFAVKLANLDGDTERKLAEAEKASFFVKKLYGVFGRVGDGSRPDGKRGGLKTFEWWNSLEIYPIAAARFSAAVEKIMEEAERSVDPERFKEWIGRIYGGMALRRYLGTETSEEEAPIPLSERIGGTSYEKCERTGTLYTAFGESDTGEGLAPIPEKYWGEIWKSASFTEKIWVKRATDLVGPEAVMNDLKEKPTEPPSSSDGDGASLEDLTSSWSLFSLPDALRSPKIRDFLNEWFHMPVVVLDDLYKEVRSYLENEVKNGKPETYVLRDAYLSTYLETENENVPHYVVVPYLKPDAFRSSYTLPRISFGTSLASFASVYYDRIPLGSSLKEENEKERLRYIADRMARSFFLLSVIANSAFLEVWEEHRFGNDDLDSLRKIFERASKENGFAYEDYFSTFKLEGGENGFEIVFVPSGMRLDLDALERIVETLKNDEPYDTFNLYDVRRSQAPRMAKDAERGTLSGIRKSEYADFRKLDPSSVLSCPFPHISKTVLGLVPVRSEYERADMGYLSAVKTRGDAPNVSKTFKTMWDMAFRNMVVYLKKAVNIAHLESMSELTSTIDGESALSVIDDAMFKMEQRRERNVPLYAEKMERPFSTKSLLRYNFMRSLPHYFIYDARITQEMKKSYSKYFEKIDEIFSKESSNEIKDEKNDPGFRR